MPATPPVRNAIFIARCSPPSRAAAATRTLPRTHSDMPVNPVRAGEQRADEEEGAASPADAGRVGRQQEQYPEDNEDEDAQRPELPSQVRRGALLYRLGNLLHLRGPLGSGQDLTNQHARDGEGSQGDDRDDHNPGKVAAANTDRDTRSTRRQGGAKQRHSISLDVWRAPLRQSVGQ